LTTSAVSFIESPAAGKSPANPPPIGPLINATGEEVGLLFNRCKQHFLAGGTAEVKARGSGD